MATKMTREEAINIVRNIYQTDKEKEALEILIPELAESEDERIRRWLCDYFSSIDKAWIHKDITCIDILRWLEKQKDSVSNNFDDVWNEEDCEEIIAEGQKLTPRFKKLLKEVCHAWYDRGAKLEKQKGQKSLKVGENAYFDPNTQMWFIKKEQKPAEWSEEDEKDMAHIIRILDDCYVYGTHDLSKTDHENLVNKLKSLRPHWKPSEEQMNALHRCVYHVEDDIAAITLKSLYEQLKQL